MTIQSHEDLLNVVLNAPIGICILDAATLTGEIVNPGFLEVAGKPAEAIVGKFYWDAFAEARVYYEDALNSVVANGKPYFANEVELMLIRHGREEMVFVTFVYSPIINKQGKVTKVAVWVLENTHQVVERQKIQAAEERSGKLAAIVESSDDAIITKSLEGIITSWNKSAQRMFGYAPEEIIGQSVLKLIPDDRQEEEPFILNRLKNGERVEHFETQRITKNKQLLDISLTISPVKDSSGKIIGISKIARDIRDKKREEQRKNDFIAMVSHELKTPLTSVRSYVQVLLTIAKKDDHRFRINALSRAEVQIKKMSSMIEDFLSLTRLEEGKINLNTQRFELSALIDEVVSDMQLLTSVHTIEIKKCSVYVLADKDKIGQVLTNLLNNAIKYSPNGGTISVGCSTENNKVTVSVSDEGVGISSENQKKLFNRFYRVYNKQVHTVSGFGIGLYLVSELLRYHDSHIEVESEEGRGSTFSFSLDIVK
jgi:PAS domain S-box-containing protein